MFLLLKRQLLTKERTTGLTTGDTLNYNGYLDKNLGRANYNDMQGTMPQCPHGYDQGKSII